MQPPPYDPASGPHDAILLDPPWSFRVRSPKGEGRSQGRYYKTLALADIYRLEIKHLAAKDAAVFCWVTYPFLPAGLRAFEHWGVRFSTVAFTWVKTTKDGASFPMGTGYATRGNPEIVLLGWYGKGLKRGAKDVPNLIVSERREPSRKPDQQYDRIERLYPGLRYLEVFARYPREGWSQTGLDLDGQDIRDVITAAKLHRAGYQKITLPGMDREDL